MKKQKLILYEFKINNYQDRRDLCAIFADNGYAARVEERTPTFSYNKEYWVIIEGREEA